MLKTLIVYFVKSLFLLPGIVALLVVIHSIHTYAKADIVEGIVQHCVAYETHRNGDRSRTSTHYKYRVQLPGGNLISGNFGFSSRALCQSHVGDDIPVLVVNDGKSSPYSFVDFFLPPLAWLGSAFVLYGSCFLFLNSYKRKAQSLTNKKAAVNAAPK